MRNLVEARERLQPALLDRLTDHAPDERSEAPAARVMNKARMREAVLRDLTWMLNAVQPLRTHEAQRNEHAARSVLNFGLPPTSGLLASKLDLTLLERTIRDAIQRFEPRILGDTLRVRAIEPDNLLDTHNIVEFEITGLLWAQPVPLELLLRTQLDLEGGQMEVRDLAAGTLASHARPTGRRAP
jgi:type VI secretion system protein ImpF